jgi:hypothetical protein
MRAPTRRLTIFLPQGLADAIEKAASDQCARQSEFAKYTLAQAVRAAGYLTTSGSDVQREAAK